MFVGIGHPSLKFCSCECGIICEVIRLLYCLSLQAFLQQPSRGSLGVSYPVEASYLSANGWQMWATRWVSKRPLEACLL